MYLQELRISNFRCFSDPQTIEFSKGINVLVGENDSGKSAIIDAIRMQLKVEHTWQHSYWIHIGIKETLNLSCRGYAI